jgi:hypothetical protein
VSKSSEKRRAEQDIQRAEEGGTVAPEEQVIDPANLGPAGSDPESEPAGSGSPETAGPERARKEKNRGKHGR